jgi:hypothetical protein
MTMTTPEAALDRSVTRYHINENKSGLSREIISLRLLHRNFSILSPSFPPFHLPWSLLKLRKSMQSAAEQTKENGQKKNHGVGFVVECKARTPSLSRHTIKP